MGLCKFGIGSIHAGVDEFVCTFSFWVSSATRLCEVLLQGAECSINLEVVRHHAAATSDSSPVIS